MDKERFECIMSGLNRYELTGLEKRFVQSGEQYFKEKSVLTDQHESILEGVYREKNKIDQERCFVKIGVVLLDRN